MTLPTNFDDAVAYYAPKLRAAGVPQHFVQLMQGEIEDLRIRIGELERLRVPKAKPSTEPHSSAVAQAMGNRVTQELKNTNEIATSGARYPYSDVSSEPDGLEG